VGWSWSLSIRSLVAQVRQHMLRLCWADLPRKAGRFNQREASVVLPQDASWFGVRIYGARPNQMDEACQSPDAQMASRPLAYRAVLMLRWPRYYAESLGVGASLASLKPRAWRGMCGVLGTS
jgi:hypothetical protein